MDPREFGQRHRIHRQKGKETTSEGDVPVKRKVVALVALFTVLIVFGYYCSIHTVDVTIYRIAAIHFLNHDYDKIYPAVADGGFRYAPITLLLFVPLALIPTAWGAAIYFLLKVGALFGIGAAVVRLLGLDRRRYGKVCGLAFLAAAGYIVEELQSGNVHFLVFSLIIAALFLIERGQTLAPAFFLALATALKVTPILFLLYFAWKREWRLLACTVVLLAMLFALPAVVVGSDQNEALLKGFWESAMQRLDESRNHALRGVLFRFLADEEAVRGNFPAVNVASLSPETVTGVWYFLTGCAMAGLAYVTGSRKRNVRGRVLEYCLLMTAILLLAPHSLRIYFSVLFFPFAVLVGLMLESPADRRSRIQMLLIIAFLVGTLIPSIVPGRQASRLYEALSLHFVLGSAVCVALSTLIRREEAALVVRGTA